MELRQELPEAVASRLSDHFGRALKIRYSLAADLTLGRTYGACYVVVADGEVAVCDEDGATFSLKLSEIKKAKVDELFSSGRLVAVTEGDGEKVLSYYTKACVPQFAVLCRVINDLVEGREPELPDEDHRAYCSRCGAPLPERGGQCPMCVSRWHVFRRLLRLCRPYRLKVSLLVACTFVAVGSQVVPPYVTKLIVDSAIVEKNVSLLSRLIGVIVGCGLVMLVSHYLQRVLSAWLATRMIADLRQRLHAHLQRLKMQYFNRHESGELVARVMNDTGELQHFLTDGMPFLMVNSLSFLGIAVILAHLDWKLSLWVFLPVPFLIFGGRWFWRRLIPLFYKRGSRTAGLHTILAESIRGVKAVKAFGQERRRSGQFSGANEELFRVRFRIESTFVGFFEVMFWIMSLGVAGVWLLGARRIILGGSGLTLGVLLAFVGYIWLFYGPMQWFATVLNWMTFAFAGAERIFAVLDSQPEVYDAPDAVELPRAKGHICLRDVHFSYERGKEVIKGVSVDIPPGEMVGLVGKSGAGKSTLINLICRFYDVDSGEITVDGHPLRKLKLAAWRRHIGIVMQEPFLFSASILENIRYGNPWASFEEVVRAAQAAHAHDFILAKEDGYDTVIGEGGAGLSVGERQRLSIARAILHDPPVLILDEATSSVDSETEKAIQEAIANLIQNRTTIAIAHRLATLRNANRLVVIEDGQIAETGTHDELLRKDGIYAKLVETQAELSRLKSEVWTQ